MQEELKRNNSIGNSDSIDLFLHLLFDDNVLSIDAINHSFRYHSLSQFNCFLALLLFEELKLITISENNIAFTNEGIELSKSSMIQRKNRISEKVLDLLLLENLINYEKVTIDSITGELKIPINAFSLSAAIYRNLLCAIGCFSKEGFFFVFTNNNLREQLKVQIAQKKKKTTQAELLLKLQKQQEDGDKAEIFVLQYEKYRLGDSLLSPQRVSVIDAGAGYDIISCQNDASKQYDRYIEVKSFRGNAHFYWSSNEKSVSETLKTNYFLYLVDLTELEKNPDTYIPQIICNPAEEILCDNWLVEPDSYRITFIK